jgi:hypothetical protein
MKPHMRLQQVEPMALLAACVTLLLFVSGCVNRFDPELDAYIDFRNNHRSEMDAAFQALPDNQKTALFFGAMKMEPPDLGIESLVANQPYPFLVQLRAQIIKRKNFVGAYSFNGAIIEMRVKGRISRDQINALHLRELCSSTGADLALCDHQIALALGQNKP